MNCDASVSATSCRLRLSAPYRGRGKGKDNLRPKSGVGAQAQGRPASKLQPSPTVTEERPLISCSPRDARLYSLLYCLTNSTHCSELRIISASSRNKRLSALRISRTMGCPAFRLGCQGFGALCSETLVINLRHSSSVELLIRTRGLAAAKSACKADWARAHGTFHKSQLRAIDLHAHHLLRSLLDPTLARGLTRQE